MKILDVSSVMVYGESVTTTTKTITLTDLAQAVNRLIDENPDRMNPQNGPLCVYYKADTDERCLIGQALFDLTGLNVPAEFENENIETLLDCSNFRRFFGLSIESERLLIPDIGEAQNTADENYEWGSVTKIDVS